jgi:uncharacterized protein YdhG (YjbR/CyaY superfamily)
MADRVETIDEYIASFPADIQSRLSEIRSIVSQVAPEAEETISYQIPAYKLDGKILMYFAGWREHVSVYPIPPGDDEFLAQLAGYRHGKGTARFALDQPLPGDFIERFAQLHVERIR